MAVAAAADAAHGGKDGRDKQKNEDDAGAVAA